MNTTPMIPLALDYLNELIEDGMEFPDATWKVIQRFDMSVQELKELYDNPLGAQIYEI